MMKVLFVHENTLGHGSYLPPFVSYFRAHRELGIEAELLSATPLPPELEQKANRTVRGLRRFGLDNHFARWREIVSAHVREQVARRAKDFDALVVNTQSVGLDLVDLKKPLFVALDATFHQLSQSRWFSDPPLGRIAPKLIYGLIEKERRLFEKATRLLPWSRLAAQSMAKDYAISENNISELPPSVEIPQVPTRRNETPRALFVGGDFKRKGGDVLLETFERSFRGRIELDIVTQTEVRPTEGVRVWRNIQAGSDEWRELWESADLFVFPSTLETFGIVLIEAMAFGVAIISSRAGAAEEILESGATGMLIDKVTVEELSVAIETVLDDKAGALRRVKTGVARVKEKYQLATNSARLAELLRSSN